MYREALALGSDTRPPILYRGDYDQWRDRFLDWIEKQDTGEDMLDSINNGDANFTTIIPAVEDSDPPVPERVVPKATLTIAERQRKKADRHARSYLLQSLPNEIYTGVDSHKTAHDIWHEIEKQMKGTVKGKSIRFANAISTYENFKQREGEMLESTYYRLCNVINEL
jgi:hypothetical protein